METRIIVRKPNGTSFPLTLLPKRKITQGVQTVKILGDHFVTLSVSSTVPMDLEVGDKITVYGEEYTLNMMPEAFRNSQYLYNYNLKFESKQYDLLDAVYFNTDRSGFNTTSEFPLIGDLSIFVEVLMNNLSRVFPGKWILGNVKQGTGEKQMEFNTENCLNALQKICKEFGVEFTITTSSSGVSTINIDTVGQILGHNFRYGRPGGLYKLNRSPVDQKFFTRLYAYGGSNNLKTGYRNNAERLMLPGPGYIEDAAAKAAYGVIEQVQIYDDIFPSRTGTVTATGADQYTFSDAGMDFDLAEETGGKYTVGGKEYDETKYLIAGVTAKITFISGGLHGYEFELKSYNHATKTFVILPYKDVNGMTFPQPSGAFAISAGDKYKLTDIYMPDGYVTAAEQKLLAEAELFLEQNNAPKVNYGLTLAEDYLIRYAGPGSGSTFNFFGLGDTIQVKDVSLKVDRGIRITGWERQILRPYAYQLTLGDSYEVSIIDRAVAPIVKEINTIVRVNSLRDGRNARQGWLNTLELQSLIFDTDGYFTDGHIKPESIETLMLTVGAKSQQFILEVVMEPNYQGDPNVVKVNAGVLTHYAVKEDIITWQIQASMTSLNQSGPFYIYGKCHKTNTNDGNIIFSTQKIKPDDDAVYYHFLIGVIHSAIDKVRWISLTYGATTINGRFIKTGRIQSFDGNTYFDLDMNEIGGKIKFVRTLPGGGTELVDVREIDKDLKEFVDVVYVDDKENLQGQIDQKIETWFQDTNPAADWTTAEERVKHNGDIWYKGNTSEAFRYNGSNNTWTPIKDKDALAALANAAKAQDTADGKRTTFTGAANPKPPYQIGDIWLKEDKYLLRSIANKLEGQFYDPLDWVTGTFYDNTVTTIDGGIVTSGRIQLAGINGSILAGISGEGTGNSAIRFWAGASYETRGVAPYRVNQGGEMWARRRIEIEGYDDQGNVVGQAGLAGANIPADGPVRFWAGTTYGGRANAPFRVLADGSFFATKGQIGNMQINAGGLTNQDSDGNYLGQAYVVMQTSGGDVSARIGTNVFSSASSLRAAGYFKNSNTGSNQYALVVEGRVLMDGFIRNGQAYKTVTGPGLEYVDPAQYDVIFVNNQVTSGDASYQIISSSNIKPGKEILFLSFRPESFFILNTIRGNNQRKFNGGTALTLVYGSDSNWYVKSEYDNDF